MRSEPTTEVKMRRLPWSLAANASNATYSQLLTGRLLDFTAGIEGRWMGLPLDRYSILFAAGIAPPLLGIVPLRRIQTGGTSMRQLAGMVLHGRPRRPARRSGTG